MGANPPSAQKAIDDGVQAAGGARALGQIRTEALAGNLTDVSTGKTGSWSLIATGPDRFYSEIIIGPERTAEAYNGMSAWAQDAANGLRSLTGDAAARTEATARYWNDRLVDLRKSKLSAQFAGTEKVRGRDAWHIRLSHGPGLPEELFFDTASHVMVRQILPTGQFDYDDFRAVQGMQIPFRIELRRGGQVYNIALTRAEFNGPVDDSVFNFPHASSTPLPDIGTLLREVTKNQKAIDDLQKQYTCHLTEEKEDVDSKGQTKSKTIREYEVFNLAGEEARRLLAKDGRPLTGDEKKKEDGRFNKQYEKLRKREEEAASNPKKQAEQEAKDDAQISDFLRVVRFTNARRERFRGADVIAVDFGPNPDYKPKKMIENAIHEMAGVVWIDEQARDVARLEAHFSANVRIGGVVAALEKGSSIVFEQARINNEVWLPTYAEVHLGGRFLLVRMKANEIDRYSDYKRFRAESTFVPEAN